MATLRQPNPTQALTGSEGKRIPKPKTAIGSLGHEPNGDFLLMAHPGRWGVSKTDKGYELLPVLAHFSREAGINGVAGGAKKGDPVNDTLARAYRVKKGWIIIEDDFIEGGYMRVHDTKYGPNAFTCTCWAQPMMAGNKPIIRNNEAMHWEFLRAVAEELLPPPVPEILDDIKDVMIARLSRQLEQAEQRPNRLRAAEDTQDRIDSLEKVQLPAAEAVASTDYSREEAIMADLARRREARQAKKAAIAEQQAILDEPATRAEAEQTIADLKAKQEARAEAEAEEIAALEAQAIADDEADAALEAEEEAARRLDLEVVAKSKAAPHRPVKTKRAPRRRKVTK